MADREKARFKANDSLECRSCQQFGSMDFTEQMPCATEAHQQELGEQRLTCMDCHKGMAHQLPDMSGVPDRQ